MMNAHFKILDNKKSRKVLAKMKKNNPGVSREVLAKRLGLISWEQSVSATWRLYDSWISH